MAQSIELTFLGHLLDSSVFDDLPSLEDVIVPPPVNFVSSIYILEYKSNLV